MGLFMFKRIFIVAIGVLNIFGCSSNSFLSDSTKLSPSFFIKFEENSSTINNVFALSENIQLAISEFEKKPTIVLVAVGHSMDDYNLALSRLYSVSNVAKQDVRVLVKPLDIPSQKDLIAVHVVSEWTSEYQLAFEQQEFSEISQLHRVFSGNDDRYFYRQPRSRVITFTDKTLEKQFDALGKSIGWNVSTDKVMVSKLPKIRFSKLQINTLSEVATSFEATLLFDQIIEKWLPNYSYHIDARNKIIELLEDKN